MKRIRWTAAAFDDLKAISPYIEQQRSLTSANSVCRSIYDSIQVLRRFPESGKPGLVEETREWVLPSLPYIVAYRLLEPDGV